MAIAVAERVAEALRRSTVQVRAGRGRAEGIGSGVVLSEGRVITNAHVIRREPIFLDAGDMRNIPARCVQLDRPRDLALLLAPGLKSAPACLGDSAQVRSRTPVFAVGNPLGFVGAVSSGLVHGIATLGGLAWIQADVRLAPGSSGGPLADLHGSVIGINAMVVSGGLGLAVPSRAVQSLLARAKSGRSLGVTVRPVEFRKGKLGIMILETDATGAAARASLLPGDILAGANGSAFRSLDDLQFAIDTAPAFLLQVDFYRGGQEKIRQVAVQLDAKELSDAA